MTPPREPPDDDRYDALPAPVQHLVSRAEFAWLSDAEKARIVDDYTEPDAEDRADA